MWVLVGSVLVGAVHDFGSLVVSMRSRGQTVGDVAGRVLNTRVRLLFLLILFMALTIVLAIFGLVIAAVFKQYPASIFPCVVQIPIAIGIGFWLHRKGMNLLVPSILALVTMYWFETWRIGLVMALALAANLLCAAIAGFFIPLTLKRLHIDPALAGGVVLTTVTDVVGLVAFLGFGTLLLL